MAASKGRDSKGRIKKGHKLTKAGVRKVAPKKKGKK